MRNDAILIPGEEENTNICETPQTPDQEYLTVEGSLKEIADNNQQGVAQRNLNVYSKDYINELQASLENNMGELQADVNAHIYELVNTLENIQTNQEEFVKRDGSTPFEGIQLGLTPGDSSKKAITTVEYVLDKLKSYSTKSGTNKAIEEKLAVLDSYALISDVYKKANVYCKAQIDKLLKEYVKRDGSTSFQDVQDGQYPRTRTNLATKGYADDVIKQHKNELDPHNFLSEINKKLSNYYKKSEVYTKAQSYSRIQLDAIIDKLVQDACTSIIEEHINTTPHLTTSEVRNIVKTYANNNLVTEEALQEALENVSDDINNVKPIWKTSGPVLTTVGFVEDNTDLPKEMTMQEILDAIFYGSKFTITADETVPLGSSTTVTICSYSGISAEEIKLYKDGQLIATFSKEDIASGCVTEDVGSLLDDTELKAEVTYANGSTKEATTKVKVVCPAFAGLLPKWKRGFTVTYDYLIELSKSDSVNNKFITKSGDIIQKYNFQDAELRHPFIAVPTENYSGLYQMVTPSQQFGTDDFDIIGMTLQVPVDGKDPINKLYTLYIYKQAISNMNLEVTYKFK